MGGSRAPENLLPYRPLLRLSPELAQQVHALGLEELGSMVSWAIPNWLALQESFSPQPEFDNFTTILRPQPQNEQVPAAIWYDETSKCLACDRPVKNESFRQLVRELGLSWEKKRRRWERPLGRLTGSPNHRVAELATILYKKGWPVALGSQEIVDLVVEGRWIPEQKRWVQMLTGGDLLLTWEKGGDAVYKATEHLPSARWSVKLQGTIAPAKYACDVRDFAEQWNFAVTAKALAVLESAVDQSPPELLGIKLPDTPAQPARKRQKPELAEDQGEVTIPAHLRFED